MAEPADIRSPAGSSVFFLAAATAFVTLHAVAAFLVPERLWGAHHLRFLPVEGLAIWCATLGCIAAPPGRRLATRVVAAVARAAAVQRARAVTGGLLAALALFLLFRSHNHFNGDGFLVLSIVADPEQSGADHAGYFVILLHKAVLVVLRLFSSDARAEWSFALVSALAGVAALWLAWRVVGDLLTATRSRVVLFSALAASGGIALFFGHAEGYPVLHLAILAYLACGIRFLRGKGRIVSSTLVLIVAAIAHPLAMCLAPSWIVLAIAVRWGARRATRIEVISVWALVAAGAATLAARARIVAASTYGGLSALVPLVDPSGRSAYTLFSLAHAAFLGNELLLALGGTLLLPFLNLPPAALESRRSDRSERSTRLFLAAASAGALLAVFLVDPKFGSRDWDLMALPLFPVTLLIGHGVLAGRAAPSRDAVIIVAGAMVLHTVPWVWVNTSRDRSVEMILAAVAHDPHYTKVGQKGYRFLATLLDEQDYRSHAERAYILAAAAGQDAADLRNVGLFMAGKKRDDEAISWLERSLVANAADGSTRKDLASIYARTGRHDSALRLLREHLAAEPGDCEANVMLGSIYMGRGDHEIGLQLIRRAVTIDPEIPQAWHALGLALRETGFEAEALDAFAKEEAIRSRASDR